MFISAGVTWRAAVLGRWMALILGTLMVLFFLAFFFGEGPPHFSELTTIERLQFLAMGALFLGLVVSWKWEGFGGLLAVAGFLALVAISRSHLRLWAFDLPAAFAMVHLVCWWRLRTGAPADLAPWHLSRNTLLGLGAALALFLFLCANEIFGQPPLMTPAVRPSDNLLGTWAAASSTDVVFTVHEDATVTGSIGGIPTKAARITHGRSWFGKLLNWNADYVIRGRLSERQIIVPLMVAGPRLEGTLVIGNRPMMRLKLGKQ